MVEETTNRVFSAVEIKEPLSHGPLSLFPLAGGNTGEPDMALLAEAVNEGSLTVEEMDESGSVPELRLVNSGDTPVLILEGDELAGAKQNRVVNSSVLVPADAEIILPVSCVERGRWSYRTRGFSSAEGSPHISLRRLKSRSVHDSLRRRRGHWSDQGAVWREVGRKSHRHDASSPTEDLLEIRDRERPRLDEFDALADRMPETARGVVVAVGGRPVLAEMLAGPRTFSKAIGRLLRGYAFEALELEQGGPATSPGIAAANTFLGAVIGSRAEEHVPVGAGRDVRFSSASVLGYALVDGDSVLHAAAFAA